MKKIGILAMAAQGHGGTLLYSRSMVEALLRLPASEFSFVIFAQQDNHEYNDLGLPIQRLPNGWRILWAWLLGRDLFSDVSAVIAPIYSTRLLATKRPFAFTLHDLQEKHLPENFSWAMRIWRHATNRILTTRAARIICESQWVKRDISQFLKVDPGKVTVIAAPPIAMLRDCVLDNATLAATRAKFKLPPTYLFYPAQFWPHKNHLRLVKAFAQVVAEFPGYHLVLTGKKRDDFDRVMALVAELGLAPNVLHLGYVEQTELAALYRCATAAVIPTLFESISIPVYEAFSIGTPVCVSNVVALPEQVGDAGILFDPYSVDDIAAKVSSLLRSPALRAELVERGRQRIAAVDHTCYARALAAIIEAITPKPIL